MATIQVIHVRRCHVCGAVNEEVGASVHRCSHCGKHLAPFYFFEEGRLEGLGDDQIEMSRWSEATGYRPLWGFSTYWSQEVTGTTGVEPEEVQPERQQKTSRHSRRHRRSSA